MNPPRDQAVINGQDTTTSVTTVQNYVGGRWVASDAKQFGEVYNPARGEVIAKVPLGTASDVDRVSAALEIELGEMDALRLAAIGAACGQRPDDDDDHLSRLAETAAAASSDGHVLALANIARARRRLATAH